MSPQNIAMLGSNDFTNPMAAAPGPPKWSEALQAYFLETPAAQDMVAAELMSMPQRRAVLREHEYALEGLDTNQTLADIPGVSAMQSEVHATGVKRLLRKDLQEEHAKVTPDVFDLYLCRYIGLGIGLHESL